MSKFLWRAFLAGLVVALFWWVGCSPAFAEDTIPDSHVSSVNNSCTANAHLTIDDDPDAPGGDWCTASTCSGSSASNVDIHVGFATPSGNPTTGTDDQVIAVYVRQCSAGSGTPSCALDIYCNGTAVDTTSSDQSVTNTTGQLLTEAFTFSTASCAADGSDLEVFIDCNRGGGSPSNRRAADVDAVEWRASVSAPGGARHAIVVR